MPRLKFVRPASLPDPRLTRVLTQWLILGLLACVALPAARGYSQWIGWLWYWLLAAPAIALCVLHRARWLGAWRRSVHGNTASSRPRRRTEHTQAKRERVAIRTRILVRAG